MIDWYSVLLEHGVSVPDRNQFTLHCPFHEDQRESCAINVDKGVWICFAGCGQGSLKYFIWKLSGRPWEEVNEQLTKQDTEINFSDILGLEHDVSFNDPREVATLDTPEGLISIPSGHWIYKRGFTAETLVRWGCKTNNYNDLVIPVENKLSEIVGYITRRQQAIPKYMFTTGFAKASNLFGINQLYETDTLYVVEGALDAMWLNQHGYSSVAVLGASVSHLQVELISSLKPSEVVLALDNDEAGKKGTAKATLDMHQRFLLSYLKLPKGYKDVQEIYNTETLHKLMQNKAPW